MKRKNLCLFTVLAMIPFFSAVFNVSVYSEGKTVVAVKSRDLAPYNEVLRAFKKELEGQNIGANVVTIDIQTVSGEDAAARLCKEIEDNNPAVIFSLGTPATALVQKKLPEIPVMFSMVLSPKESDIKPPGISMDISAEDKLQRLTQIIPKIKNIGCIYSAYSMDQYQEISTSASSMGLQTIGQEIYSEKEFYEAFKDMAKKADCFLMVSDPKIYSSKSIEWFLREGLNRKLIIVGLSAVYTKAGALISFDCNYSDLGKQSAEAVVGMFSDAPEPPQKYIPPRRVDFYLNKKVMKLLGVHISEEEQKKAKEIFGR